jgi:hypothetical protein
MLAGVMVFDGGDVGLLVGFALRVVEDGFRVVAARLWLSVEVDVDGGLMGF